MTDLDPKLTFDSFVVGPANRLASAAARRAADSPGTSYNPLFLYSASGLGKSHILHAIAYQAQRAPGGRRIEYMALEGYLEKLTEALESGARDSFRDWYGDLDILLLDDVQFLTGQNEAQEMLLRTLDQLSSAGSQIVLASDRPPAEIDGLDARLLSRFSGGLIVDIGAPEYETRVAIIRKKADARGQKLAAGVAEALGRYPFRNVRELGGALNKIFATQDIEEREVGPDDVARLMGDAPDPAARESGADEFGSFLADLTGAVAQSVEEREEPWRKALREAVDHAERQGFSARRLKVYRGGPEPEGWDGIVEKFRGDIQRLQLIDDELDRLGNPWPEAAQGILKDPDRLDEAEALLSSVRERQRPFPKLGDGPDLDELEGFPRLVMKAAQQLVGAEKPEYNPLYVWSGEVERGHALLAATGRTFQARNPQARMAVTSVADFAQDFIRALGDGVAGAWRERWWTVDLLLVHGVEALSETERAQDEFFHLFEALKRRGARVLLVGDRAPAGISRIDERLRSRFEGGLVLEVDEGAGPAELELVEAKVPEPPTGLWEAQGEPSRHMAPPPDELEPDDWGGVVRDDASAAQGAGGAGSEAPVATQVARKGGAWFPSAEKVVIQWPKIDELLQEELE
ncbi:MAG: DnaA/Hda family protein [Gemmatimonadota bacterium]|jgi:chromosomal replication initiation ATPase DnaA